MMKQHFVILCLMCIVKSGVMTSTADAKVNEKIRGNQAKEKVDDLEGSETSAKLFNLASLFPSYSSYPSYRPVSYYPSSTGGNYYPTYTPTTQGVYPSTGYYPTGTNFLGAGYGGYPTQSYYPSTGYVRTGGYGGNSVYRGNSGYGGNHAYGGNHGYGAYNGYAGYNGYGGYGGYGGNGGLKSYYGYDGPTYTGKRNLGFGYYSDTDRYGFYRSPTQHYSVNRGYD